MVCEHRGIHGRAPRDRGNAEEYEPYIILHCSTFEHYIGDLLAKFVVGAEIGIVPVKFRL